MTCYATPHQTPMRADDCADCAHYRRDRSGIEIDCVCSEYRIDTGVTKIYGIHAEGGCTMIAHAIRKYIVVVFFSALVPFHQSNADTPFNGVLQGQFAVSPTGAATYTVPIEVPPGINGLQPELALVYNSQAGNGILGVGWQLSGLSAITRCPKTYAQDGVKEGIKLDITDRYCLDGQRLVPVDGNYANYGKDGKEYRTEINSFAKIV